MKEKTFDHGEISGFLDEGTSFIGELKFSNTMRIDGKFEGKIKSKNVLIVGETAEIKGEVDVSNISINGKVSGKIFADEKVEIHSKGQVFCDITTQKLVIEDGAFFQGKCNMDGLEKSPAKGVKSNEPTIEMKAKKPTEEDDKEAAKQDK